MILPDFVIVIKCRFIKLKNSVAIAFPNEPFHPIFCNEECDYQYHTTIINDTTNKRVALFYVHYRVLKLTFCIFLSVVYTKPSKNIYSACNRLIQD